MREGAYQYEYSEQQSPNVEPRHVCPKVDPQRASVETTTDDDAGAEEVVVEVAKVDAV